MILLVQIIWRQYFDKLEEQTLYNLKHTIPSFFSYGKHTKYAMRQYCNILLAVPECNFLLLNAQSFLRYRRDILHHVHVLPISVTMGRR